MDKADTSGTECWRVDTLDVDQADSHLLETSRQTRIMIEVDEDQIVNTLDSLDMWDETKSMSPRIINEFVTTHIHDDHIAGAQDLKDGGYTVQQAYRPPADRYKLDEKGGVDRIVLEKYLEGLAEQGIDLYEIESINSGDTIIDEKDAILTALSPPPTDETIETTSQSTGDPCKFKPEKANPNGVVCAFEGPDGVSGLFMGDVGDESAHNAESWLYEQHADPESDVDLDADILYLGHHGSNKSTGEQFLDAVDPEHVVVSSGLDNNYTSENQYDGHPHDETLERLHDREIDVHWTAVHGTMTTTVEDGTVQFDHDTKLETTAAADIAALKYHARANDFDQEDLPETETIELDELPEETPDWVAEASLVTDRTALDTDRIDELHALEVEHGKLKQEKFRLEETRDQRSERTTALEQERENSKGLTDRVTTAVSSLWKTEDDDTADETREAHTTEQVTADQNGTDDPDQQAASDTDEQDQWEDQASEWESLDAAINAYKQRNATLRADVTTLTEQVDVLADQIETLDTERTANDGLFQRLTNAVGAQGPDQQSTETAPDRPTTDRDPTTHVPTGNIDQTDTEPSAQQSNGTTDPNAGYSENSNERSKWLGPSPPEETPDWILDPDSDNNERDGYTHETDTTRSATTTNRTRRKTTEWVSDCENPTPATLINSPIQSAHRAHRNTPDGAPDTARGNRSPRLQSAHRAPPRRRRRRSGP